MIKFNKNLLLLLAIVIIFVSACSTEGISGQDSEIIDEIESSSGPALAPSALEETTTDSLKLQNEVNSKSITTPVDIAFGVEFKEYYPSIRTIFIEDEIALAEFYEKELSTTLKYSEGELITNVGFCKYVCGADGRGCLFSTSESALGTTYFSCGSGGSNQDDGYSCICGD
jgi:hypothetical protein